MNCSVHWIAERLGGYVKGLKMAILGLSTSFWGLNKSEFNPDFSHGLQKNPRLPYRLQNGKCPFSGIISF